MKASERIISLYEENAEAWDRQRGRDLHEQGWLARFAALLPPGGQVLDIGCGMGEPIARWLVERGFRLTGVDSAASLVAMARQRMPAQSWRVADMRELALGRRFDGVLAWHSFFHLTPEDQQRMFRVFAAHALPRAPLMFTSGPEHGENIGEWRGEPLYHGSLAPGEYQALLEEHGFDLVENRLGDPECGHSCVWLARRRA